MKKFRLLLCLLLCVAILAGQTVYSEGEAPEIEIITEAPIAEPVEEPVEEPTAEPVEEPTEEPSIKFKKSALTYDIGEFAGNFDYKSEFALEIVGDVGEIKWSSSDNTIADFVDYQKKDQPDVIITRFEVYLAGTVIISAKPERGEKAEFTLKIEEQEEEPETKATVSLDKAELALSVGQTATLTATVKNGEDIVENPEIAWTVEGESVTVDKGAITGVKSGASVVKATYGEVFASCNVTVSDLAEIPLTGISVSDITIFSGKSAKLTVLPIPENATEKIDESKLSFSVKSGSQDYITLSGGEVTSVTTEGLLKGGVSEYTETVVAEYGALTCESKVTVRQSALKIVPKIEPIALYTGELNIKKLEFTIEPESADDKITSYISGDETIFTVDNSGATTALQAGETTITVLTESGLTSSFPVKVAVGIDVIEFTMDKLVYGVNESVLLKYVVFPELHGDSLTWTSSKPEVATVDSTGLVTFVKKGKTVIRVESGSGAFAEIKLTAGNIATSIELYNDAFKNFTGYTLGVGQSVTPVIDVLPSDIDDDSYTMTSMDSTVARVSYKTIIATGKGETNIEIVSGDGFVKIEIPVTVVGSKKSAKSLSVNASSFSMSESATRKLTAKVNSTASNKTIFWGVSDESVIKVNKSGKVTALSGGTAYVYAMASSGIGKRVKVTVKELLPTLLRFDKTSVTKYPDKEFQLNATVYPSGVNDKNKALTWATTDPKVALVTTDGMVQTVAPGTCYITASTVNGKKNRCKVTVKARKVNSIEIVNPYTEMMLGGTYHLSAETLPATATEKSVTWSLAKASRNFATIDSETGELYCKAVGEITVKATAKDGSGTTASLTVNVISAPLNSLTVTKIDGTEILNGDIIEMKYSDKIEFDATVSPDMYLEISTNNSRVASVNDVEKSVSTEYSESDPHAMSVKSFEIAATGAGTAKITITAGGLYTHVINIEVPKDETQPDYRALVIGQYQNSSEISYLPFSKNCAGGAADAIRESVLNAERYSVSTRSNLTTSSEVLGAIKSTFANADENDVSVIYMLSHGTMSGTTYRWHLYGKGQSATYVSGAQIVKAIGGIKGNVVLVICSCYSGGDSKNSSSVPGMVRALDKNSGDGASYSVLCSSDGMNRSSFADTIETRSYDFFSYSFCKSIGWNLLTDSSVSMAADENGDNIVTLSELAKTAKSMTANEVEAYIKKYGDSAFFGPDSKTQSVTYYISPDAQDLAIMGK